MWDSKPGSFRKEMFRLLELAESNVMNGEVDKAHAICAIIEASIKVADMDQKTRELHPQHQYGAR